MTDDNNWDALRAYVDVIGMQAVEEAVASGKVSREVAGQRVAHFNDMFIEKLKKRVSEVMTDD